MYKITILGALLITISTGLVYSCPTCLGNVSIASEPFFNKDFYQVEKQRDEEYNQQLTNCTQGFAVHQSHTTPASK